VNCCQTGAGRQRLHADGLGFWLEDDSLATDAAFGDSLTRGFARFKSFLGAERLDGSRIIEPRLRKSVEGEVG